MRTIGVGPGYATLRADVTVPSPDALSDGGFATLLGLRAANDLGE